VQFTVFFQANSNGGALYITGLTTKSDLRFQNISVFNNSAPQGGGISFDFSSLPMSFQSSQMVFEQTLIYGNYGYGIELLNAKLLSQNFTLSNPTLLNNFPSNIDCTLLSINYCSNVCFSPKCTECSGTCDIEGSSTICHDSTNIKCSGNEFCEYKSEKSSLVPYCRCRVGWTGERCNLEIEIEKGFCTGGWCWYLILIVGLLLLVVVTGLIVKRFRRLYYEPIPMMKGQVLSNK